MESTQLRVYQGTTALITGRTSGVGKRLGGELAGQGAEVFLADLQREPVDEVAVGIRSAGAERDCQEPGYHHYSLLVKAVLVARKTIPIFRDQVRANGP